MRPSRNELRLPWFAVVLLGLMPACYLSHGVDVAPPPDAAARDVGVDAPPECVSDTDCADADRCTVDRCVGGRCTYEPISFSSHAAYPAATGGATDVTSDGARALVLTDTLGVEPFDASGPAGPPTLLTPTGGIRDWDSGIASNGEDALVVTLTETSIVLQSLTGTRHMQPVVSPHFIVAAWTGTRFVSIEDSGGDTCTLRELDPALGFVGDPVPVTCPHPPARMASGVPPWKTPVRGANGEVRVLSFGRDRALVEWTESGGTRSLAVATPTGRALHSFVSREVDGLLGAAWVREDDGVTTVVAAVLEEDGDRLVPINPPIERAATEDRPPYSPLMSAAACSHRFVLVAADATGVRVLELDRRGDAVSDWRSIGPVAASVDISSACIDGGVVIAEPGAVHVLTCEP